MDNNILDMITLGSIILNGLTIGILLIIFRFAKDHTLLALKASLFSKTYAVCARWTVDHKLRLDVPVIDPLDPFKWSIKKSKDVMSDREVIKGTVLRGPDNLDYVLITDDCTTTIDLDKFTEKKVGSSPAYVQKMLDLKYTEGYQAGFQKSTTTGLWNTLSQNLGAVIVVLMMLGMGFYVFHDKFISTPGVMGQLSQCNQDKEIMINKCAKYVDLSPGQKKPEPNIPTPPNAPQTGQAVT